jgi:Xaa-Pro aminopeptidase
MAVDFTILNRLTGMRAAMAAAGVDGLIVSQPENRQYLSGFTGSSGWLLITSQDGDVAGVITAPLIATDSRYYEQVGLECPGYELVKIITTFAAVLPEMLARTGVRKVAFEADHATYAWAQAWTSQNPAVEWAPTEGMVLGLRATKDANELATLRTAIALADEALAASLAQVRPGVTTEADLAWLIESYMRTHGAQAASFDTIVACGPNGARPHARPGSDKLAAGEPIVIDMGARVNGYCSDLTRTVCFGQPNDPDRFWAVYNTVQAAQLAAEAALRPGMPGPEGDAVARNVIAEAGFGEYFGHGLGHGVGLAIHEWPRLGRTSTDTLAANQVVTVEPGIYLPGWGGVRIEDIALITEDGAEVLTRAPKDPII